MNSGAPRFASQHALSLTTIASRLAPTGGCVVRIRVCTEQGLTHRAYKTPHPRHIADTPA
ncbi:hypothetical protein EJA72_21640 [Pseudomonas sp. PB120]|nr:hypothetical protein [Pseudomonas sp. PB120]